MIKQWTLINNTLHKYTDDKSKLTQMIKFAGFDIDGTIISTKSGRVHPINCSDWKIKYKNCKLIIENLSLAGYTIVFITNQSSIGKRIDINDYKKKIEDICKYFDCKITVFVATAKDQYRKPKTTIIDHFYKIIKKDSFYCGDAAGRYKNNFLVKDFSDTDYKFALNLDIKFYIPEELLAEQNTETREKHAVYAADTANIKKEKYPPFIPSKKEIIVNTGYPGSGKSYYTNKYILPTGYKYINQDQLKTFNNCIKELKKLLSKGENVVIDNTHPDKEKRQIIIKLCHEYKFKVRSIHFKTNEPISVHNSHYRNIKSNNQIQAVPSIAFNIYKNKFMKPTLSEGFYKIEELDYVLEDGIDYTVYNMMLS